MIRTVVTRGYGNGTFDGTIALVALRGYFTGDEVEPPVVEEQPPPTPSGGVGTRGRGNFSSAWRKQFEREEARRERLERREQLARVQSRGEALPRQKDREFVAEASTTIRKAIEAGAYSDQLAALLGEAAEVTKPRQITARMRQAERLAEELLAKMIADALAVEPQYEMTDEDIAAILLLS